MQGIFIQAAVLTGYVLISHNEGREDKLDTLTTLMLLAVVPSMIISWAGLLLCAAKLHKASKDCIGSWGRDVTSFQGIHKRYFAKFRKSCVPIYFGFPGVMMVKHGTVLKFMQTIVKGMFRVLLALKRN